MATVRYTGNSINQKQTDVYTVASPASGLSTYTITVNGKAFVYVAASAVAADVATALVAAYGQATDIKETQDSPATVSGADVTFQSPTAGVPFTNSYGVTGGGTFNGSTTVANSGSGVFDTAANWSATINAADDLVLEKPGIDIGYRLDQLSTSLTSFTMRSTFTGSLGLPIQNPADYPEYRGCYAKIVAPLIVIGLGEGGGCSRAYIETNAGAATKVIIYNTGSSSDDYPTVMLKHTAGGSNSFSIIRIVDGSVGIALLPGEASTVTLLEIGDDNTSPAVFVGVGAAVATMKISSGSCELVTTPSTLTNIIGGADVNIVNGGAATTIEVIEGSLILGGNGTAFTITNLTVGGDGILDLSRGNGAITVTNGILVYSGARIIDPLNRLVTATIIKPQQCQMSDTQYVGAAGITWAKS